MDAKPLIYQFNGVRLDLRSFQAFRDDSPLPMEPKALEVLVFMIENRGRLIEKQEILDRVWPHTAVTENAMTRVIAQLRRVLGDDAKQARYIETVPKRGYRFIAPVREVTDCADGIGAPRPTDLSNVIEATGRVDIADSSPGLITKPNETTGFRAGIGLLNLGPRLIFVISAAAILTIAAILIWRARSLAGGPLPPKIIRTVQITNSPGLDISPSFSPDGSSIVYSSNRAGGFEICIRQLSGGREKQITSDGLQNFEPAWSPDGAQIAYCSKSRGGICVVSALGGVARQLTDFGSHPEWSPDGRRIAFQSAPVRELSANASSAGPPSTIWVVPATGGAPAQVTLAGSPAGGHGAPSWSPDASRIVFSTSDFTISDVWSVAASGGQLQPIVVGRQRCYEPVYSPDGRAIYFSTEGAGLFQQPVSSITGAAVGEPVQIISPGTTGIRCLALSASGRRMLYSAVSVQSNLWSIPISSASAQANGSPRPLTQNSSYRNTNPAFSPDGQKIAFSNWRRAATSDVWLMDRDGNNQAQLTASISSHNLAGWYQDVDHLAYLGIRDSHWGIESLTLSAGREVRLAELPPNAGFFVRVSPDGRALAYHSADSGAMNVWIEEIPGGQARQLTFDNQSMGFPCWSPDSQYLACEMTRGDDTNICIVPSAGGAPVQLTHDPGLSWAFSWSPDGDKIAFAGSRNGIWNVYWVSRSTGEQKQITAYSKTNAYVRYPAWSPLGNQMVYEYAETTGNIWMAEFR